MLRLGQVRGEDRMVDVLVVAVSCRQCGGPLHQINGGASDGVSANWVGKCVTCRREYAVVAEMVALRNPSNYDHHTESATS